MRLIDADKLRKQLLMMECMEDVVEIIDNEPTAYDVDKVVEQLEEISNDYVRYNPPMNDYENGFEVGVEVMVNKAIEIVEDGGD